MLITDEMVERARQAWLEKASDYELLEVSIRAALEAALGAAVSDGWEDISSAPETGETILVYRPDAGVFTAHYVEEDAHLSSAMNPPEGDFFWFTTGGEDLTDDMPTHWRPLPAPPSE